MKRLKDKSGKEEDRQNNKRFKLKQERVCTGKESKRKYQYQVSATLVGLLVAKENLVAVLLV